MTTILNDSPSAKAFLTKLFLRAVEAADPATLVPTHLPTKPRCRVLVIGAGKASARMAEAVETQWGACEGLVITRYGHARPTKGIEIVEASHPIPDDAGVKATKNMLHLLNALKEDDHVIALISGGGSALLCAPAHGLSLSQKQQINADLLASGASISEINIIRKSLSQVKGGRLATAAYPASLTALIISDVPGDDPALIASGPTISEYTPLETVLTLRKQYLPHWDQLDKILRKNEPINVNDPRLAFTENSIIATPSQSLEAAAEIAKAWKIPTTIMGDAIEGEARTVAIEHAKIALSCRAPHLFLSGGELTVTKQGSGVGGPNAEYALALALALKGADGIFGLAGDTDGVDGAAEIAGAFIDPTTISRSGIAYAQTALQNNDAHRYFESLGDQIITGPTLTNVNDFRAILKL